MRAFVDRNRVWLYFAMTFAISWGTVVIAVGTGGFPGTEADFARLIAPVVAAMLLGPSVSGILVAVVSGTWSDYRDRLKTLRAPSRWYAYALLIAPLSVLAALAALRTTSPVYTPGVATAGDPLMHALIGVMTGVAAGLFEELGWTGIAVPALRKKLSWFGTGLIVGIAWGAWHIVATWWGSAPTSGGLSMWVYLPIMDFAFLVPYRILMVRMYDRTPSIPMAMLMHFALTASVRVFDPLGISGVPIVTYNLAMGGAFWVLVGVFAWSDRER